MDAESICEQVDEFFADAANRGVADVHDAVELTQLPESRVRRFCRQNGLRRLGTTYCLDQEDLQDLLVDSGILDETDDDETDDDETDDDETDDDETDDDETDDDETDDDETDDDQDGG